MYANRNDDRVRLAVLCDYALTSEEGKVSAVGLFSSINFAALPATYPRFFVLIIATLQPGNHSASISLQGPSGNDIVPRAPGMNLDVPEGSNDTNLIIGFDNLTFESAGIHQFQFYVDESLIATIPFAVMATPDQQSFPVRGNA